MFLIVGLIESRVGCPSRCQNAGPQARSEQGGWEHNIGSPVVKVLLYCGANDQCVCNTGFPLGSPFCCPPTILSFRRAEPTSILGICVAYVASLWPCWGFIA